MHGVAHESSGVAPSYENPGCLSGSDLITIRLRKLHVLREVSKVFDRLRDRVHLQPLCGEDWVRVRVSEEAVLDNNRRAICCLRNHTIDRMVGEVTGEH